MAGQRYLFRRVQPRNDPYRLLLWSGLILGGVWLLLQLERGVIQPPFLPTPTPTRVANSYIQEAQAYIDAGKLDDPNSTNDAIDTYRLALQVDPENAQTWAALARIQAYSSALLSSLPDRRARLQEALASASRAVELAPDDSRMYAIYTFVLDWNASVNLDQRQDYLNDAEAASRRALQLDPNNALALAFYAEVLADQQQTQAEQYAEQAVALAPDSMDVHRVYATVLETLGAYRKAIEEYQKAAELAPNFTYLYLRIGLGYRNLGLRATSPEVADALYLNALLYFDRAAAINEQLGVKDPSPYIAIAKTYTQQGEFFSAALNAEKALSFDPTNADTYGQLGMVYVQAKNYEAALPILQCAVEGCTTWWRMPPPDRAVQARLPCAEDGCAPLICEEEGCSENEKDVASRWFGPEYTVQSVQVSPLALADLNVAYYYIRYGSVLAYLSRPGDGQCEKTLSLMATLTSVSATPPFSDDIFLPENIQANDLLCTRLMATPTPSP